MVVLLQGFLLGFVLAAPVGPMGILCINKTLARGFGAGFATGLGIALADAVYGLAAAFGITSVSDFLVSQRVAFGVFGGILLAYLGIKSLLKPPESFGQTAMPAQGFAGSLVSGFFLTLTNPVTILVYAAIFAGFTLSVGENLGPLMACSMTLAIFVGSLSWWLMLSGAVAFTRSRLKAKHMLWINRASGAMLTGVGVVAILQIWV